MGVVTTLSRRPIIAERTFMSTLTVRPSGVTVLKDVPVHQLRKGAQGARKWRLDDVKYLLDVDGRIDAIVHPSSDPLGNKQKFLPKPKNGYGVMPQKRPQFGWASSSKVQDNAAALELKYGTERCAFVTLTQPGQTKTAISELAKWSSWVAKELCRFLQTDWALDDGTHQGVWVWENQKRGALHLHMLIVMDDPSQLDFLRASIQDWWFGKLSSLCDRTGLDLFGRSGGRTWRDKWHVVRDRAVVVVQVKKSVTGYLSKYLSKGPNPDNLPAHIDHGANIYPTQWWGSTLSTKAVMKGYVIVYRLPRKKPDMVPQWADEWASWLTAEGIWNAPSENPFSYHWKGVNAKGDYAKMNELAGLFLQTQNSVHSSEILPIREENSVRDNLERDFGAKLSDSSEDRERLEVILRYSPSTSISSFGVPSVPKGGIEEAMCSTYYSVGGVTYRNIRKVITDPFSDSYSLSNYDHEKEEVWEWEM
jgi:hypothetical protein